MRLPHVTGCLPPAPLGRAEPVTELDTGTPAWPLVLVSSRGADAAVPPAAADVLPGLLPRWAPLAPDPLRVSAPPVWHTNRR